MRRNMYHLLKSRKLMIILGGGGDVKLKDDFVSFFGIKNYKVVNLEDGVPIIKRKHVPIVVCTYDSKRTGEI